MAWRMMMMSSDVGRKIGFKLGFRRYTCVPQSHPLGFPTYDGAAKSKFVVPEFDRNPNTVYEGIGFEFPSSAFGGGSMELMAVPKRKTSPHKEEFEMDQKPLNLCR